MAGKRPKVLVLRTAGTNCDAETVFAFESCGADVDLVHINRLFSGEKNLHDYHILALPGGFSYGDDIAAGRIFANELRMRLAENLKRFINDGKLIIGICNGFQILTKAGILPGRNGHGEDFEQTATLINNDSGKFEDRWIYLKPEGRSVWTEGLNKIINLPVAHGEGKFVMSDKKAFRKINGGQVVFRYCTETGKKPAYPENPNGSLEDIAGIADKTGRVLGLMPHPERHFVFTQNPKWTRSDKKEKFGHGAVIFQNGVNYVKGKLL